jgi:hypothetical protein
VLHHAMPRTAVPVHRVAAQRTFVVVHVLLLRWKPSFLFV